MVVIKNRTCEGGKEFWDYVEKVAGEVIKSANFQLACAADEIERLDGKIESMKKTDKHLIAACSEFVEILEAIDQRCSAADGPVATTLREATNGEARTLYVLAKTIAKLIAKDSALKKVGHFSRERK